MISRIIQHLQKENVKYIIRGIMMGIMLILIYLKLLNSDYSSAPEYIYNQF